MDYVVSTISPKEFETMWVRMNLDYDGRRNLKEFIQVLRRRYPDRELMERAREILGQFETGELGHERDGYIAAMDEDQADESDGVVEPPAPVGVRPNKRIGLRDNYSGHTCGEHGCRHDPLLTLTVELTKIS